MRNMTILLVVLLFVFSGCSSGETSQMENNEASNPPAPNDGNAQTSAEINEDGENLEEDGIEPVEPEGEIEGSSLCGSVYFPVVEGASWTYTASESFGESYTFTDTVTGASEMGFTLVSDFGDLTKSQTWACREDGLVSLEYDGGGEGSLTTSGLTADFETSEMDGVSIPNQIAPGDSWTQTFVVDGEVALEGGIVAKTGGTVTIVWTAVGPEEVSVPAGTFEAIKLAVSTNLDFSMDMEGVVVPFVVTEAGHIWLVEGLGWVKTVSEYTIMEMAASSTVELTTYSIP